ncbi:phospholipase effector Tle1 domain-containing protein [Luteimonas mephitis]|uniref:phospholipase effector Tle1 domain-containing protein n=1 Tax=Luteimonas mephitis TaxID=83615 RepID=UPI000A05E0C3|nr:DUF2235 domain-containing protein [Luteimonas mephitis]
MGTIIGQSGGVETYPADANDLESYRQAEADLAKLRVPVLLHAGNPHERLYLAALDGTGNSMVDDDRKHWSSVAEIYDQVLITRPANVAAGYVEGTYTQEGFLNTPKRLLDGRFGITFEDRVETTYYQFCLQAKTWLREDPQAQIRLVGVGFSRGAEEVAALERLIEERGIRDPDAAVYRKDVEGLITSIEYADRPLLVPPGETLQAALLFDPVVEGVERFDRRLPSSTMSTYQISAEDERRNLFKVNDHVPPDFSEDNRNLNSIVGGVHSDIGNTYEENGLGVYSFNLGVAFLNRLSDRPYLQKQAIPDDPALFVVHRSEQGMHGLYGTSSYDKDGLRDRLQDQSPQPGLQRKDPISAELEMRIERRAAPVQPGHGRAARQEDERQLVAETMLPGPIDPRKSFLDGVIDRLSQGALARDDNAMAGAVDDYLRSPMGRQFAGEVARQRQDLDAQEQQAALDAQLLAGQQAEAHRNPHVMHR